MKKSKEIIDKYYTKLNAELSNLERILQDDEDSLSKTPPSSIPLPKSIAYYKNEIHKSMEDTVKIFSSKAPRRMDEILQNDLRDRLVPHFSENSLPEIFRKFFLSHLYQLSRCKFLQMMRWKQICNNSRFTDKIYSQLSIFSQGLIAEFNKDRDRVNKFSHLGDANLEDVCMLLNHLISSSVTGRRISLFEKMIHWIDPVPDTFPEKKQERISHFREINSDYCENLEKILHSYNYTVNVDNMTTAADQLELYTWTQQTFSTVFNHIKNLQHFKLYSAKEKQKGDPQNTMIKLSTWKSLVTTFPRKAYQRLQFCSKLYDSKNYDHPMETAFRFTEYDDLKFIRKALKRHCHIVKDVAKYREVNRSSSSYYREFWQNVYGTLDDSSKEMESPKHKLLTLMSESGSKSAEAGDDEDYFETVSNHGMFLSYHFLRFLEIKKLQRKCLGILNYFISLERIITNSDSHVVHGDDKPFSNCTTNRQGNDQRVETFDYVHDSPLDYAVNELDFMEFSDPESHFDFYVEKEGILHTIDPHGHFVVYEAATSEFDGLKRELLLLSSYYLQKIVALKSDKSSNFTEEFAKIDRFEVLYDIWTCEYNYLQSRLKIVRIFFEVLLNCLDHENVRKLHQIIIDKIYERPRFDGDEDYFKQVYELETALNMEYAELLLSVATEQVRRQRNFDEIFGGCRLFGDAKFVPEKSDLISITYGNPAICPFYFFEFQTSLCGLVTIGDSIGEIMLECGQSPCTDSEAFLSRQLKILEQIKSSWVDCEVYEIKVSEMSQNIFNSLLDNPSFAAGLTSEVIERRKNLTGVVSSILELIKMRQNIICMMQEKLVLSLVYKRYMEENKIEEYHLYLRYVQFDFGGDLKEGKADQYIPKKVGLCIEEIDNVHMNTFDLATVEGVRNVVTSSDIENVRIAELVETTHCNLLFAAIAHIKAFGEKRGKSSSIGGICDFYSNKSEAHSFKPPNARTADALSKLPEFISIQLEKRPIRDKMLRDFAANRRQKGIILQNPEELKKNKRSFIVEYCKSIQTRVNELLLKSQIAKYYKDLNQLLDDFVTIREGYFTNDDHSSSEDCEEPQEREGKEREREVILVREDKIGNIFYVPSNDKLIHLYENMEKRRHLLENHCEIIGNVYEILNYLCIFTIFEERLLTKYKTRETGRKFPSWGGQTEIGKSLHELQKCVDRLSLGEDSVSKTIELLVVKRDVLFLALKSSFKVIFSDQIQHNINKNVLSQKIDVLNHFLSESPHLPPEWNSRRFHIHYSNNTCVHLKRLFYGFVKSEREKLHGVITNVFVLLNELLKHGNTIGHLFELFSDDGKLVSYLTTEESRDEFFDKATNHLLDNSVSIDKVMKPIESLYLQKTFLMMSLKQFNLRKRWSYYRSFNCQNTNEDFYASEIVKPIVALLPTSKKITTNGFIGLYPNYTNHNFSEFELFFKSREILFLLGRLECFCIEEITKRIQRLQTLAVAEKQRFEETLPVDLWRKKGIEDILMMNRSPIIEDFCQKLLSSARSEGEDVTWNKSEFMNLLQDAKGDLFRRERESFESYTNFYQTLMTHHNNLLRDREHEIKTLRYELSLKESSARTESMLSMCHYANNQILENNYLKLKLDYQKNKMKANHKIAEREIAEKYGLIVERLMGAYSNQSSALNLFTIDYEDEILQSIKDCRSQGLNSIMQMKVQQNESDVVEQLQDVLVREIEDYKRNDEILRSVNKWIASKNESKNQRQIFEFERELDKVKMNQCKVIMSKNIQNEYFEGIVELLEKKLKIEEHKNHKLSLELSKNIELLDTKTKEAKSQAEGLKQLDTLKNQNYKNMKEDLKSKEVEVEKQSLLINEMMNQYESQLTMLKKCEKIAKERITKESSLKLSSFKEIKNLREQISTAENKSVSFHWPKSRNATPSSGYGSVRSILKQPRNEINCGNSFMTRRIQSARYRTGNRELESSQDYFVSKEFD